MNMKFEPPLYSLDEKWKSGKYNNIIPLRSKLLLDIGGKEVVPNRETMAKELINEGEVIDFNSIEVVKGRSNQCHKNSCLLYQQNNCITHIGTGWALSDDDFWRQHSWAIKNNDTIVETTVPREIYYGICMNDERAEKFIKNMPW